MTVVWKRQGLLGSTSDSEGQRPRSLEKASPGPRSTSKHEYSHATPQTTTQAHRKPFHLKRYLNPPPSRTRINQSDNQKKTSSPCLQGRMPDVHDSGILSQRVRHRARLAPQHFVTSEQKSSVGDYMLVFCFVQYLAHRPSECTSLDSHMLAIPFLHTVLYTSLHSLLLLTDTFTWFEAPI